MYRDQRRSAPFTAVSALPGFSRASARSRQASAVSAAARRFLCVSIVSASSKRGRAPSTATRPTSCTGSWRGLGRVLLNRRCHVRSVLHQDPVLDWPHNQKSHLRGQVTAIGIRQRRPQSSDERAFRRHAESNPFAQQHMRSSHRRNWGLARQSQSCTRRKSDKTSSSRQKNLSSPRLIRKFRRATRSTISASIFAALDWSEKTTTLSLVHRLKVACSVSCTIDC
jgi:hypothetical protein